MRLMLVLALSVPALALAQDPDAFPVDTRPDVATSSLPELVQAAHEAAAVLAAANPDAPRPFVAPEPIDGALPVSAGPTLVSEVPVAPEAPAPVAVAPVAPVPVAPPPAPVAPAPAPVAAAPVAPPPVAPPPVAPPPVAPPPVAPPAVAVAPVAVAPVAVAPVAPVPVAPPPAPVAAAPAQCPDERPLAIAAVDQPRERRFDPPGDGGADVVAGFLDDDTREWRHEQHTLFGARKRKAIGLFAGLSGGATRVGGVGLGARGLEGGVILGSKLILGGAAMTAGGAGTFDLGSPQLSYAGFVPGLLFGGDRTVHLRTDVLLGTGLLTTSTPTPVVVVMPRAAVELNVTRGVRIAGYGAYRMVRRGDEGSGLEVGVSARLGWF